MDFDNLGRFIELAGSAADRTVLNRDSVGIVKQELQDAEIGLCNVRTAITSAYALLLGRRDDAEEIIGELVEAGEEDFGTALALLRQVKESAVTVLAGLESMMQNVTDVVGSFDPVLVAVEEVLTCQNSAIVALRGWNIG